VQQDTAGHLLSWGCAPPITHPPSPGLIIHGAQGTATDAVLLNGQQQPPALLAKAKVPTTADVLTGIAAALRQLQQQHPPGLGAAQAVFLGTTQFVNAVVQRQGLAKVFVVRLCGTATKALPPFLGIPAELQAAVVAGYLLASGMCQEPVAGR